MSGMGARLVCALALGFAAADSAPTSPFQSIVETGAAPPPEGRPPIGPLQRTDSRKWEVTLVISLPNFHRNDKNPEALVVGVSTLDTWWQVDPRSFRAQVSTDLVPVPDALTSVIVTQSRFGDSRVEVSLPRFVEYRARAEISWVVETWSCQFDEDAAAKLKWPSSWPEEVERWRRATPGIDPADPQIQALRGQLQSIIARDALPLTAAKEAIRLGCRALRSGDHKQGNPFGELTRGIELWGIAAGLSRQVGSEADTACICVALLRSFGFPARPVIGLADQGDKPRASSSSKSLVVWGEVYLPECGWVPFDPDRLRGGVSGGKKVNQPWSGFGSDSDFNNRVPITHELDIHPPSTNDAGRTASYAALCRLKAHVDQPRSVPTDILIQTTLVSRGVGRSAP